MFVLPLFIHFIIHSSDCFCFEVFVKSCLWGKTFYLFPPESVWKPSVAARWGLCWSRLSWWWTLCHTSSQNCWTLRRNKQSSGKIIQSYFCIKSLFCLHSGVLWEPGPAQPSPARFGSARPTLGAAVSGRSRGDGKRGCWRHGAAGVLPRCD